MECLTEHDRGVLDSVVGVNVPVAGAFHVEVYQGMPSEGREHVIEEPNPGRDLGTTCPIQVETYPDFRLRGLTFEAGGARRALGISLCDWVLRAAVSASLKACISAGVPADTRNQPSGPVSRINTPRSSKACHTACRSANRPNRTKLASDSATSSPRAMSQRARSSRACRS